MLATTEEIRGALNPDDLLKAATQACGLSDFGDERYLFALRAMVEHYAWDIQVDATGLKDVRDTTVRLLVNRARFEADLKAHPEILDEDVRDPIVILGLPRSGTTKTHRLMGVDPNLLKTYMWQLVNPAPFPDADPNGPDPRIAAAVAQDALIAASNNNPELRAAHLYGATEVQEDIWLAALTFNDHFYSGGRPMSPSYSNYLIEREHPSTLDNMRYICRLYQYLQWQQGGRQGRRWLIKNTGLVADLDTFLQVHPQATLVHLHRDPRTSVASLLRLSTEWFRPLNADIAPGDHVITITSRLARSLHRYLDLRDKLGLDDRIYDVPYEKIRVDPMPVVEEIYRRAGHTLAPESVALMHQYERDNEQGKHGAHTYTLEQYGLTNRIIESLFGEYRRRFITGQLS